MEKSKTLLLTLAAASLAAAPFSHAVETDPVGYVTFTVPANSDLKVGVPLQRSPVFAGSLVSVSGSTATFSANLPDLSDKEYFLLVTDDSSAAGNQGIAGRWYQVDTASGNQLTVVEDLAADDIETGDSVAVIPFWTLDTLFPSSSFIASSDITNPIGVVQTNDVNALGTNLATASDFLYHDGSLLSEGWYTADTFDPAGSTIISPETNITIRNNGALFEAVFSGTVPTSPVEASILSRSAGLQDNQIANPYPSGVRLSETELVADGAIRPSPDLTNPLDRLLIYPEGSTGQNQSASVSFFYHDGSLLTEGWYNDSFVSQDDFELPAGAALIIRRGVGTDEVVSWTPPTPYEL